MSTSRSTDTRAGLWHVARSGRGTTASCCRRRCPRDRHGAMRRAATPSSSNSRSALLEVTPSAASATRSACRRSCVGIPSSEAALRGRCRGREEIRSSAGAARVEARVSSPDRRPRADLRGAASDRHGEAHSPAAPSRRNSNVAQAFRPAIASWGRPEGLRYRSSWGRASALRRSRLRVRRASHRRHRPAPRLHYHALDQLRTRA